MGADLERKPTKAKNGSLQSCPAVGPDQWSLLLRLHNCIFVCRVASTTLKLWKFIATARLQSCGHWDQAVETARKHDRINLKAIHFAYAQYLESMGDGEAAIRHYEQADTHR